MKKSQSSDYFSRLEKTIDIDKDGNATFAKDVLADGTIGGNTGFKILHTYRTPSIDENSFKIDIYVEKQDPNFLSYTFFGLLTYYNPVYSNLPYLVLGTYQLDYVDKEKINYLSASGQLIESMDLNYASSSLNLFEFNRTKNILTVTRYATSAGVQKKLFRHRLVLNGDVYWDFICTSNLKVDSVQDLTTITNATNGDAFALDSKTQAKYEDLTWTVGTATISTVSDTVTTP